MKISNEKLAEIVDRIKTQGSSLGQEARALGMTYRTTIITALRNFMGREAYDEMISGKRPRSKEGVSIGSIERPRPDDAGLSVVESTSKSDGWSWRYVSEHEPRPVKIPMKDKAGRSDGYIEVSDAGERILVLMDPDGVEYVRAEDNEKAHLLRANPTSKDGPRIRLVRWQESKTRDRVEVAIHRAQKLLERGEDAKEAKREHKDKHEAKLDKLADKVEPAPAKKSTKEKKKHHHHKKPARAKRSK